RRSVRPYPPAPVAVLQDVRAAPGIPRRAPRSRAVRAGGLLRVHEVRPALEPGAAERVRRILLRSAEDRPMIVYTDSLEGITPERLGGFFHGWAEAPSPHE